MSFKGRTYCPDCHERVPEVAQERAELAARRAFHADRRLGKRNDSSSVTEPSARIGAGVVRSLAHWDEGRGRAMERLSRIRSEKWEAVRSLISCLNLILASVGVLSVPASELELIARATVPARSG